jgi:hypothetical protein
VSDHDGLASLFFPCFLAHAQQGEAAFGGATNGVGFWDDAHTRVVAIDGKARMQPELLFGRNARFRMSSQNHQSASNRSKNPLSTVAQDE